MANVYNYRIVFVKDVNRLMGGTLSQNNKFSVDFEHYNSLKSWFRAINREVKWWTFIAEITEEIKIGQLFIFIRFIKKDAYISDQLFIKNKNKKCITETSPYKSNPRFAPDM